MLFSPFFIVDAVGGVERAPFALAFPALPCLRTHVGPGLHQRNCGRQISHAHQIVGRAGEGENPRHFAHSAVPHFAQPRHRLQPAETFFDAFPLALTDLVSRMPRGTRVNRAAARPRMVLRHVRRHLQMPALRHEPARIESLVAAYRHRFRPSKFLQHQQRSIALRRAVGLQSFRIHDQPVLVFHQQMPAVTQLRLLALAFARQ